MDTSDPSSPLPDPERIGPYHVLERIGEGGMGTVYAAMQEEPVRRKVALKIIKPGMDSAQVVARFEAERQALALMNHENIAQVYDGGVDESGRPYFAMEYVPGVPITDFCDRRKLTTLEQLPRQIAPDGVVEVLEARHRLGSGGRLRTLGLPWRQYERQGHPQRSSGAS